MQILVWQRGPALYAASRMQCLVTEVTMHALSKAMVLPVHAGKLLAYNCSPSFNWKKKLSDSEIATFQSRLGELGYKFQFVTLAGFHSLNHGMFTLSHAYAKNGARTWDA